MYYLPRVGIALSFVHFCWASSLYSFEYVLIHNRVTFMNRMALIEEKWSYFLGFGLPCTLLTFFSPQFINQGIFAILFPMVKFLTADHTISLYLTL